MGIPMWLFYGVMNGVFGSIGVAVVYFGVYDASKADAKIATLANLGLGWTYLGAFAMKVSAANAYRCTAVRLGN